MSRPSDHIESAVPAGGGVSQPTLGPVGYARFFWRQLTSMRTALILLLLLAIASVPGSILPQRTADPNGVIQYFENNPELAPLLDSVQLFDVFGSVWFASVYLLLFISLIGCIIPRTRHHLTALRTQPPRTPARLERLPAHMAVELDGSDAATAIASAQTQLRKAGFRTRLVEGEKPSVAAERGYLRETGNLLFHLALVGVLISAGIVGSLAYTGQKVIIEGHRFINVLADYSSFNPGSGFDERMLEPFMMVLDSFEVEYESENLNAYGFPVDYTAFVSLVSPDGTDEQKTIKVNQPLPVHGYEVYLLGNGYAPKITVRDGDGNVAFSDYVAFLPQDNNLTSLGVIKVPDAAPESFGMIGFFYPTAAELSTGALTSVHADLQNPVLTLNVYTGDMGLDDGVPRSVYELNIDEMTQVAGGASGTAALELRPGESATLPGDLGTVTFESAARTGEPSGSESVLRFATFDITHDPSGPWVLLFSVVALAGLILSLVVPRRRFWVRASEQANGRVHLEYGGLARGEDPGLMTALNDFAENHIRLLTMKETSP